MRVRCIAGLNSESQLLPQLAGRSDIPLKQNAADHTGEVRNGETRSAEVVLGRQAGDRARQRRREKVEMFNLNLFERISRTAGIRRDAEDPWEAAG